MTEMHLVSPFFDNVSGMLTFYPVVLELTETISVILLPCFSI